MVQMKEKHRKCPECGNKDKDSILCENSEFRNRIIHDFYKCFVCNTLFVETLEPMLVRTEIIEKGNKNERQPTSS